MIDIVQVLVPEPRQAELAGEADKAASVRARVEAFAINNHHDEQVAADLRAHAKAQIKRIEEQRKTVADPLRKAKTALDDLVRPLRREYEQMVVALDAKLAAYATAQRDARRLDAEARIATGEPHEPPPAASTPSGLTYPEEWQADADLKALILAEAKAIQEGREPQWLTVDWSAIKLYLKPFRHSKVVPPVEGLTFRRVVKVRAR